MRYKHGLTSSSEYRCWKKIKARCYDVNNCSYANYGGRGIAVCKEWRASFQQFLLDMGLKPGAEYSVDRIDNNGNYCKENCRWATRIEQQRNKRNNAVVGSVRSVELATTSGLPTKLVLKRLRSEWSPEQAAGNAPPPGGWLRYELRGKKLTLAEWARSFNVPQPTLESWRNKVGDGWLDAYVASMGRRRRLHVIGLE